MCVCTFKVCAMHSDGWPDVRQKGVCCQFFKQSKQKADVLLSKTIYNWGLMRGFTYDLETNTKRKPQTKEMWVMLIGVIYLLIYLLLYLFTDLLFTVCFPFIYLPTYLSIYLFIYLFTCSFIYPTLYFLLFTQSCTGTSLYVQKGSTSKMTRLGFIHFLFHHKLCLWSRNFWILPRTLKTS